ncbi:hypothetical protein ACFWZI_010635, partial [Salmonella enterica]
MTIINLKSSVYEYGDMYLESHLDGFYRKNSVQIHKKFAVRLVPDGGVWGVKDDSSEPTNILFF